MQAAQRRRKPARNLVASAWGSTDAVIELLADVAADDEAAVERIVRSYLPRLATFVRYRGANDPDGIADLVLSSVLHRLDELEFTTEAEFWAYLCLSARSRIIDEHRAARPLELVGDPLDVDDVGPGRSRFDEQIVTEQYVAELLSPLTADQRTVLELRFLDDLSIEETALRTGLTKGAVKGLQRRAIHAILAAVGVLVVIVALRAAGGEQTVDDGPADQGVPDSNEAPIELPTPGPPTDGPDAPIDTDNGVGMIGEPAGGADGTIGDPADGDDTTSRYRPTVITAGTTGTTEFDASATSSSLSRHGVRIYCVASHLRYGDPLTDDPPDAAPLTLHWGNTAPSSTAAPSADTEAGTCEGGVVDRSWYWMPAVFDDADRFVLPEHIRVEFKAFGDAAFDRETLRTVPTGLELFADGRVEGHEPRHGSSGSAGGRVELAIHFPSCVAVDAGGRPILSSPDGGHLSYDEPGSADNCPELHPYRIPTISFILEYDLPADSAWYLAGGSSDDRRPTGGLVAAWNEDTMAAAVRCVRQALVNCGFDGGRGQLPERFLSPDGIVLYEDSVTLAAGVDRTPFGPSPAPVLGP
ncbi:MAG: sigma-70 family RNA polymerase sigma factor [Actinomycetota bacterium]